MFEVRHRLVSRSVVAVLGCGIIKPGSMKSVEFIGKLSTDGCIDLPPEIAGTLPSNTPLQIVVSWNSPDDDAESPDTPNERFAAAYVTEDSVYEQLSDSETRFGAFAARGSRKRGLELLDKLDRAFERR
jgi:hypothetical protein